MHPKLLSLIITVHILERNANRNNDIKNADIKVDKTFLTASQDKLRAILVSMHNLISEHLYKKKIMKFFKNMFH